MASGNVSHVIGALNNFEDCTKNKWLKELLLGLTLSWSDVVLILGVYSCPNEKWEAFEIMINNYYPSNDIHENMFELTDIFFSEKRLINAIFKFVTGSNYWKIERLLKKINLISMMIKLILSCDENNCWIVEIAYDCGSRVTHIKQHVETDIFEFLEFNYLPDYCLDKFVQSMTYRERIDVNNDNRSVTIDLADLSYATKRNIICSFIKMYSKC